MNADVASPAARWALLWALGTHLRAERGLVVKVIAVAWLMMCLGVAVSVLSVLAVTAVVTDSPDAGLLVALVALCVALLGLFAWTDSWLTHVLAYRVIDTIRLQVHAALARLAPLGLGRRRSGDTAATAMADAEALEWFYAHTIAQFVAGLFAAAAVTGGAALWLGWPALLLLTGQLLVLLSTRPGLAWAERQGTRLRAEVGALSAETVEARQAARELVLLDLMPRHRRRLRKATDRIQSVRRAQAVRTGLEQAALEAIIAGTALAGLLALLVVVNGGGLPFAQLPAGVALMIAGLAPCVLIATGLQRLGEMSSAAARLHEVIAAAPLNPDESNVGTDDASPNRSACGLAAGILEVHDVWFGYPGSERPVLCGVDLAVAAGEHVALVGASGAGKTTLLHLLVRLFEPTAGRIVLDGTEVTHLTPTQTRRRINLVAQHPHIFRLSLRDNLLIVDPNRHDDDVLEALQRAGLAPHVASLPEGIDTVLAEHGATWSGGQRQRLGLTRGLLLNPEVLVLDEPTANLDPTAEEAFLSTLADVRHGRTTIIASHRESTLRRLSRVVFLDEGRVVDEGTHDSLVATNARYRAVVTAGDTEEPTPTIPTRR